MQKKQRVYNTTVDVLRVLSILAVVAIHTSTRLIQASGANIQIIPVTFFINQASRFAVPLFFMISSFVLELNYPFHTTYITYLKKRFSRIVLPYIFWSTIYYFFIYKVHTTDFLTTLFMGNASYQLYFIPTLLIFYLLFPLLHKQYRIFSQTWMIGLLGVLQIVILYYDYYIHPLSFFYPLAVALLNFYIFMLGAIASHHTHRIISMIGKWKYILMFCAVFLAIYIFFEGENRYLTTHNYLSFYSQWRPSILIYSLCIIPLMYYVSSRRFSHLKCMHTLSKLSFFVFFVHVIILDFIWNSFGNTLFGVTNSPLQQLWFDPVFFLVVSVLSFLLAFFVHKISFLKKITA